jgi:DNA-binding NarL/FixJ family response regulator
MPHDEGTFPMPPPSARILIVEDDFFLASTMQDALRTAGCDVIGLADDTSQPIVLAARNPPDFAIMDIRLAHGDDGADAALARLKRFAVRSIFGTAHTDGYTRSRGAAARPLGWFVKPCRMDDLLTGISNALVTLQGP